MASHAGKTALAPGAATDGVLAEEAVYAEHGLVATPAGLSDEEAATLPCAAVTAWNALFVGGRARAGQTALLLGTGGVSIWGLQLAKAAGLRAIVTSSSNRKLEQARELGADVLINYRETPEWRSRCATDGDGAHVVVEVGGQGTLGARWPPCRAGTHDRRHGTPVALALPRRQAPGRHFVRQPQDAGGPGPFRFGRRHQARDRPGLWLRRGAGRLRAPGVRQPFGKVVIRVAP